MTKVIKDGKEVIEWEPVNMTYHADGNVGIGACVDKDLNVTHLDMDLCANGPHNTYTALALAIWNAALEEAVKYAVSESNDTLADSIRELKK